MNGLILASGVSGRDTKEASLIKELCGTIPEQSVHAWAGLGGNGRNSKLRSFFWLTAGRNQTPQCASVKGRVLNLSTNRTVPVSLSARFSSELDADITRRGRIYFLTRMMTTTSAPSHVTSLSDSR